MKFIFKKLSEYNENAPVYAVRIFTLVNFDPISEDIEWLLFESSKDRDLYIKHHKESIDAYIKTLTVEDPETNVLTTCQRVHKFDTLMNVGNCNKYIGYMPEFIISTVSE
jgi:hypothetical protein